MSDRPVRLHACRAAPVVLRVTVSKAPRLFVTSAGPRTRLYSGQVAARAVRAAAVQRLLTTRRVEPKAVIVLCALVIHVAVLQGVVPQTKMRRAPRECGTPYDVAPPCGARVRVRPFRARRATCDAYQSGAEDEQHRSLVLERVTAGGPGGGRVGSIRRQNKIYFRFIVGGGIPCLLGRNSPRSAAPPPTGAPRHVSGLRRLTMRGGVRFAECYAARSALHEDG